MNRKLSFALFPLIVLLLSSLACGSSNTGEKVGSTASSGPSSATKAVPKPQTYKIGDIVKVEDHTITLNSANASNGTLVANFSINNSGAKELAVSSMISFEAKDGEGAKLEQSLFDCPSGSLDGKVLAGDNLKGNICWKLPAGASGIRIYYTANLFGSGAVVWTIDGASQQSGAVSSTEPPSVSTKSNGNTSTSHYKVGDVVKVEDHTIVLNSAKVSGGVLAANFMVSNAGSKDLAVSSMLSFEAKDAEGSKLEQDIGNCPSGSLDGSVLPGDRLKGNICWKVGAGSKGIRLYYTANPFGGQAVVWDVQ